MQARPLLLCLVAFVFQSGCSDSSAPQIQVDNTRTVAADRTGHMRLLSLWANRIPVELLRSPLYHDEQRIHIGKLWEADEFGSLVAIAATQDLAKLDDNAFPDWVSVAMLNVQKADEATEHSKLKPGYSCIYIRRQGNNWEGLIKENVSTACPAAPASTDDEIEVVRYTTPNGKYPGAVRLEMSRSAGMGWKYWLYSGIRCGEGWCTVSHAEKDLPDPKGTTYQELVPGWHDDQYLSYKGQNGLPRPSKIRARVVPNDKLFDPVGSNYVDVGYIDTDGRDNRVRDIYRAKWDLDNWEPGQRITIALKKTGDTYFVKLSTGIDSSEREAPHVPAPVKEENGSGTMVRFFGARAMNHLLTPIDIPGTVRFAWYEGEDGIWLRCDNGCCTVN